MRREQIELSFGAPGTGTLVAKLIGVPLQAAFPIEVVSAPASMELVHVVLRNGQLIAAPEPVMVGELVGSQLVARTADGRFVGGVTATWSSPDAVTFLVTAGAAVTESVFWFKTPGSYAIVTAVGSTTITTQVTAQ
jgi:hypothetical protein